MRHISRFVAFLLALLLILAVTSYIAGKTIWSPSRLQQAAQSSGASEKAASFIPEIISSNFALSDDEKFIVKTVVTPERIAPVINQVFTHFAVADGTPLSFDLSNYRQAISSEGLPLPPNLENLTSKPITIISSEFATSLASVKQTNDKIRLLAPILALVFAVLIIFIAKKQRFLLLAQAFIASAIGLGLIGLVSPLIPGLAASSLGTSAIAPLKDVIITLLGTLAKSAQSDFYLAGMICAGVGVVLFITHGLVVLMSKFSKKRHHG